MLALAMAVAIPAMAQQQAPDGAVTRRVVARALQLSAQQVTDWEALWATRENTIGPLREELKSVRAELKALLDQSGPDAAKVGELTIEADDLRDRIAAARKSYLEGFEALLDAGQATRLDGIRRAARVERLVPAFENAGLVRRPRR